MALLKCLEPVTAIACGLGAFALGSLDGGLTAGAMIGGAALMRAFGEARSKHGLESKAHIERTRLAILRVVALDDLDQAARDSIGLADTALAAHLASAMPSREALGAAAVNRDRYPAAACALILERLEQHDLLFSDDPIARDFATRVIEAALEEGLNNPEYIQLLSVHILTAVAQGVAEANAKLDRLLALVEGSTLSVEELRGAIARFVVFQPNASDADVLNAVATFERDYRALLEQVSHISVHDNHIKSLKSAAEEALEAGDIATARTRYAEAAKAAAEKASEPVRNTANLKYAEASAALAMLDWHAADAAWEQAATMMMPFDPAAGENIVSEAGKRLYKFGEIFAQTPALAASERRWRVLASAQRGGDIERVAKAQNNLGIVLWTQGEWAGGDVGMALLCEAVDVYRAALTILTQAAMPALWAVTQNNLGLVLKTQGERTGGEEGLALLSEAVEAYCAALTVRTQAAMPAGWAMTQNNLGNVLTTQGEQMRGDAGLVLLRQAVEAYRAALSFYTHGTTPADWATTQNNLGAVLQVLGERTGDEAGLVPLREAVDAYRAALTIHTQAAMPADWAMTQNNLGTVLRVQSERTEGEAGLALLGEAVEAHRAALTVRTQAAMPTHWATTQYNLGKALHLYGERTEGEKVLALMEDAVAAYRNALSIWTPEHFSHYHELAKNDLAQASAAIAARRG